MTVNLDSDSDLDICCEKLHELTVNHYFDYDLDINVLLPLLLFGLNFINWKAVI